MRTPSDREDGRYDPYDALRCQDSGNLALIGFVWSARDIERSGQMNLLMCHTAVWHLEKRMAFVDAGVEWNFSFAMHAVMTAHDKVKHGTCYRLVPSVKDR
jgi:hypothetical protein